MEIKRIPQTAREDASRVARAGQDIRYVPKEGRLNFSGAAHETRYLWVIEHCGLEGESVLDFGCGSGYGADLMAERAASVHGVDSSEEAILFARGVYTRPNLRFHAMDACCPQDLARELTFGTYDVVTSFDVIEHVEKYFDYVENASRLVKADGQFLLSTPNRLETFRWNAKWNPFHLQEFTPWQLRKLLSLYFEHVVLMAQDFVDNARKEAVRNAMARRNALAEAGPLSGMIRRTCHSVLKRVRPDAYRQTQSLRYSDIGFSPEPGEEVLRQAFGLMAVCKRPRRTKPGNMEKP